MEFLEDVLGDRTLTVAFFAMLGTFVSSFGALVAAIITARHARVSTMPMLVMVHSGRESTGKCTVSIENHGFGPAAIQELLIFYRGKPYSVASAKDLNDLAVCIFPDGVKCNVEWKEVGQSTALGQGAVIDFWSVEVTDWNGADCGFESLYSFSYKAVYRDAYMRAWLHYVIKNNEYFYRRSLLSPRYVFMFLFGDRDRLLANDFHGKRP
ncbi:hypothetical protein EVC62_04205 [Salinicola endophyticus]|uniref:Uncharacterized protein n=1 Tax=Salinicola endophyticus TaxID=1949083 RepID=A0ABY8FGM7_9GAMM|nr:hypothetical protein [Salinicola endophyticus]WFF40763.1 hypothetical protein EVC62_04205 [Salinicola endophyticus]